MKEVAVMLGWVISFQTEIRDAFKMAGDSRTISNFLRPDLLPRLRELLNKIKAAAQP
jgi:hypothetical protein